jgi:hypothetical protein
VVDEEFRRVVRNAWVRTRVHARAVGTQRHPLPDFVIVGAQRSGTTTLYHYLAQHPQVRAPLRKEIQFLSLDWERGIPWYRRHFPLVEPGQQTFEASPYYLFHPAVPVRAAAALPDARFIALVREPVARTVSHYQHNKATGVERMTIERALDLEPARLAGDPDGRNHRLFSYVGRGLYAEQISRWRAAVGDRLLVLLSEDFFDAPRRTFAQVLGFLGLEAWQPASFSVHGPRRSPAEPIPEGFRRRLQERFAAPNRELTELLGRDLSRWFDAGADSPSLPAPVHVRESATRTPISRH